MSASESSEDSHESAQVDEDSMMADSLESLEENNSDRFHCAVDDCQASFAQRQYLVRHIRNKHASPIKCNHENCNSYVKPESLKRHIRNVHGKTPNQCENCGELVWDLKKHLDECNYIENKNYHCSINGCKASFFNKVSFIRHKKNIHRSISVKCPREDCNKLIEPAHLPRHIQTVHEKRECEKCGKILLPISYNSHLKMCLKEGKKDFFCSVKDCKMSFTRKQALKRHEKFIHQNFKYTCESCGLRVVDIKQHVERCTSDGKRKFRCTVGDCESSFTSQLNLSIHVRRVHKDPIKCPREGCCSYVKPQSLATHIRLVHNHNGIRKRLCENCGERFANLWVHRRICTNDGVKRYHCLVEGCEASFTDESYLCGHISKTHVAAIKCPRKNCDVLLKPSSVLTHLRYVHDGLQGECSNCGKSFKRLKEHYKSCMNRSVESFSCDFEDCGISFARKGHLLRHKKLAHGQTVEQKCAN